MSWWKKILGLESQPEETERSGSAQRPSSGPPLVLMMADAGSLAALRTLNFEDASAAAEYIEFWYPQRSGGALYPFWALAGEPSDGWSSEAGGHGESIVLIRDEVRDDVVFPFSFTDMATALMFVRQEIGSGIAFDRVSVYWAIPVDISMSESGRATLSPSAPPPLAKNAAAPKARKILIDTKTTFVPKDDAETAEPVSNGDTAEAEQWLPRFPVLSQRLEKLELRETPVGEVEEPADIAPVTPEKVNGTPIAMAQNGTNNGFSDGKTIDEHTDIEDDHKEKAPEIESEDVQGDIGKIHRWRRLDSHDGPFEGFDSPRGRF